MNLINEKPINIAVIFDQEVESGGGFQQGLNAAILASKIDSKLANVSFFHTKKNLKKNLLDNGINSKLIKISFLKKIYLFIKTTAKYRIFYELTRSFFEFNFFESFFKSQNIDLLYSEIGCKCADCSNLMSIHSSMKTIKCVYILFLNYIPH